MAYFQPNIYGAVFPPQLASMPSYPTAGGGWGMGAQGGTTTTTTAPGAPSSGGMDQLASLGLGLAARRYGPGLLSMGRNVWNDYFGPPQPLPTYTGPTPWMLPEPAIGDPGFSAAAAEIPMGGMEGFTGALPVGDYSMGGLGSSSADLAGGLSFDAGASAGAGAVDTGAGMTGSLLGEAGTDAAVSASGGAGMLGSLGTGLAGAGGSLLGSYLGSSTPIRGALGGDSSDALSNFGQAAGGAAGSIVGGIFGGPPGAAGGGFLGSLGGGTYLDPIYLGLLPFQKLFG